MRHPVNVFFNHASSVQIILFAVLLSAMWVAEVIFCLQEPVAKWRHSVNNFLFICSALPIQLFLTLFVVAITQWTAALNWGILYLFNLHKHLFAYYVISFLLMDFFEYLYHVIMHKTSLFWKFHLVHHSDLEMDVSTTVREHPGETAVRVCFLMLWVFISGASVSVLIIRQTAQTAANIFAHSKIRLSNRAETIIGAVFITPNLHHVHHHFRLPFTDSNYGDVFCIWDRLFGTYKELSIEQTIFGIDTHFDQNSCGNYLNSIKIPFKKIEKPGNPATFFTAPESKT